MGKIKKIKKKNCKINIVMMFALLSPVHLQFYLRSWISNVLVATLSACSAECVIHTSALSPVSLPR